jgi:hypothetical protein
MLRVVLAFAGFLATLLGLAVAFALRLAPTDDGRGIDSAGGWALAAAGIGLCVVAVWPRHTGTIAPHRLTRKSAQ